MDPIFDFILEEPTNGNNHKHEDDTDQDEPSSPSQLAEIDEISEEYLATEGPGSTPIPLHVRDTSIALIEEYIQNSITLKAFLSKIRSHLCMESDRKDMFDWFIRSMLSCGHSSRMSCFLEENGITKDEIEAACVQEDGSSAMEEDGLGIGEKRKRRERKRVSISRGLRSPPNKWTKQESEKLIRLVFEFGDKSWKKIAEQLGGGKTGAQCAQHWKRVLSPEIRKGSWDDQEEELLFSLVQKHGQSWKNIAAEIKTRTDIQCRYQYQKACLSRGCDWLAQEDVLLRKKVSLSIQERRQVAWTEVSKFIARAKLTKIPRTALECKERWMAISNNSSPSLASVAQQTVPSSHHHHHSNNTDANSNNNSNNYGFNAYAYAQSVAHHHAHTHAHAHAPPQAMFYAPPQSSANPASSVVAVC